MKSLWCAGDFNLRGKKSVMARCGCCDVTNLKDIVFTRMARAEMAAATTNAEYLFDLYDEEEMWSELSPPDETEADWIEYIADVA